MLIFRSSIHSLPNLLPVRFFLGCICEVCSSLPNPSQGADRLYPRAQHRWTKNDIQIGNHQEPEMELFIQAHGRSWFSTAFLAF